MVNFIEWLVGQLRRPSHPSRSVPLAASVLAALLRERGARMLFLRTGGLLLLVPLLRAANTPATSQLLYELTLCVWLLSFNSQAGEPLSRAGAWVAFSNDQAGKLLSRAAM